jgi:EmrB/QacA subfamily drug resistance transporter
MTSSSPELGTEPGAELKYGSAAGWWVIAAAVLGSGIAFLDATVVNVALPAIQRDLGGGITGLQWTVDGYLLTLGSLIVFGGSLGDLYGRRRGFVLGLATFTVASCFCGAAPNLGILIVGRALQGVGGALLVPASLSMISASFQPKDRGPAIGAWSGLSGVSTAIGPFVGGYLIDSVSWRLVFLINLPLAAIAIWLALARVPETRDADGSKRPDVLGAGTLALGVGGAVFALIEGPTVGFTAPSVLTAAVLGVAGLVAFVVVERRVASPMVPLETFKSRQFVGANLVTLVVYAALGGASFLLAIHLQRSLGYSALEAGAAFLPVTILMMFLSPAGGRLASRIGARIPMTLGPLVVGASMFLMERVKPGISYTSSVLPAAIVLGIGLSLTVAPLTAAVLAAVDDHHIGVASGINNAIARLAALLAIAVLPFVTGLSANTSLIDAFPNAMMISAGACAVGAAAAWLTIDRSIPVRNVVHPDLGSACHVGDGPSGNDRQERAS